MSKLETLEVIHEEIVRRFQYESERTKHLDDKASNIMGFVGIVTGLVSGLGALTLQVPTNLIEGIATALLFLAIAALICAFFFSLQGYRIKEFTVVPNAYFLIGAYEGKGKDRIIRDLNDNYAVAIEDNMALNDQKATWIKRAMYALLASVFLIALFAFFALIK
jgi:hypothetical protein